MNSVIIAGTYSGVGKTTISIALMRAFIKCGKKIAPFKVGPDYIDPKFHMIAAKQKSYNLDSWLLEEDMILNLFYKHSKEYDLSIIEGVMGLYDGCGKGIIGSTAHIAKILKAPVILIVDATGIYTSICALILGYKLYDRDVNIKGVILNNINGQEHYRLLKGIIENEFDIECVGYFPKIEEISLNSRYLGLIPVEEIIDIDEKIEKLGILAIKMINLKKIEEIAKMTNNKERTSFGEWIENIGKDLKIAIARDKAFNFYYEDNLELMRECGIDLIEFSPLKDKKLPEDINGVYIGGGFPEIFANELSTNKSLLKDIYSKADNYLPIYCECGGLMYLTRGIIDKEGNFNGMVEFFNCISQMTKKLQRFGYVEIEFEDIQIKAHEFHHSILIDHFEKDFTYKYKVRKINKKFQWNCGLAKKNVLAGYPHIHFYSNFDFFRKIVSLFRRSIN